MGFRGKIAVLRHLEGFLKKVKKVEPLYNGKGKSLVWGEIIVGAATIVADSRG